MNRKEVVELWPPLYLRAMPKTTCSRLNICVPHNFLYWHLIPNVRLLGGGASGGWLGHSSGALMNGISALIKSPPPAYLTYMKSTSWETLGWKKHKLKSRLPGEISKPQICRWHHPYGRKWRGTKEPLDESESGKWKSWLKAQHSENEDHGIWSHHFMTVRWGNSGNSVRLYFSGLQNHCRWWLPPWN